MAGTGIGSASPWTVPGFAEERELGSGASGRVMAAVHMASGTRVAIKYLLPRLLGDPAFLADFRAEAELLKGLTDRHVVRLYDYIQDQREDFVIPVLALLIPGPMLGLDRHPVFGEHRSVKRLMSGHARGRTPGIDGFWIMSGPETWLVCCSASSGT